MSLHQWTASRRRVLQVTTSVVATLLSLAVAIPIYGWIEQSRQVEVAVATPEELERRMANDPKAALYQLVDNPRLVFEHRPNAKASFAERETTEGVAKAWTATTDEHGLRNNVPAVSADSRKLIMLGDSTTFGVGLDDAETIPSGLSRELTNRLREPVDCLNLGVSSYTTIQEVEYFRVKQAMQYAPEVVILGFCTNDYSTGIGSVGVVESQIELLRPEFAQELQLGKAKSRRAKDVDPRTWTEGPPQPAQVQAVYQAIDELRSGLGSIPLVIVLFPRSFQVSADRVDEVNERQLLIREYCQRHGVTCIDLLDYFHGCDPLKFYRPGDGLHPHAAAGEAIARIIADEVEMRMRRKVF